MDHDTGAYKHDPSMEDSSMNTITAPSAQPIYQGNDRQQASYSDTGFTRAYASADNTPEQYRLVQ